MSGSSESTAGHNGAPAARLAAAPSLFGISNAVLRNWPIVAGTVAVLAGVAVALTLIPARKYHAESSFLVQEEQGTQSAALQGIAAQLGVNMAGAVGSRSPDLYGRLLRSRSLLTAALLHEYEVEEAGGTTRRTLLSVYGYRPDQLRHGVRRLRRDLAVSVDRVSELITVQTSAPTPGLAEQVNRRLLTLLEEFNLGTRSSQAGAERRFAEARMLEARQELLAAERALEQFSRENMQFRSFSPLHYEAGRLERDVQFRQQVYASLAQAYEQARIDEVRNTPVITVTDAPEGSAYTRRGLARNVVLGALLGLVLGLVWALVREAFAYDRRANPEEYREFRRLIARARRREQVAAVN